VHVVVGGEIDRMHGLDYFSRKRTPSGLDEARPGIRYGTQAHSQSGHLSILSISARKASKSASSDVN
jgi:hypothetical protein